VTTLRPGEAVHGARDVGATAQVGVQRALAWRDFMVSSAGLVLACRAFAAGG